MDMHMHGPLFPEAVIELVKEGKLDEARIDEACRKLLTAKFKLGLFENPFVDLEKINERINTEEHRELALETARKGIVLLKNNGILPLKSRKGGSKILVTGPNANNQTILGDWHVAQPDENVITIFEGIKEVGGKYGYDVSYFDSGESIRHINDEDIKKTVAAASSADCIIAVVGDNSMRYKWKDKTAGENMGRAALDLPGKQLKLVKELKKTGKDVIVVLVNGRPISEPWLQENIPAILEAWEPGNMGGLAVGEILFGEVNPSGKLPLTVARSVGQIQMIYNHKPSQYFHKYAMEKVTPLYPFGFGLSYTEFEYGKPQLSSPEFNGTDKVTVEVSVKNSGKLDGEEVVQLYIRDDVSSATRPVKELKGYKRIFLKAGETKTVMFELSNESLAFYDIDMNYCIEKGSFSLMVGGSSDDKVLKTIKLDVSKRIDL
jgi:beta-glucosidase